VKYWKSVTTQLDMETYKKLKEFCQKNDCSPYEVVKDLILDWIRSMEVMESERKDEQVGGLEGEREQGVKGDKKLPEFITET